MRLRIRWGLMLTTLVLGGGIGHADDAQKPADPALDDELLEFLGSVDSASDNQADDGSWIDYLSQTDIGKVAKPADPAKGTPAAKPPASAEKPSDPGYKSND